MIAGMRSKIGLSEKLKKLTFGEIKRREEGVEKERPRRARRGRRTNVVEASLLFSL